MKITILGVCPFCGQEDLSINSYDAVENPGGFAYREGCPGSQYSRCVLGYDRDENGDFIPA